MAMEPKKLTNRRIATPKALWLFLCLFSALAGVRRIARKGEEVRPVESGFLAPATSAGAVPVCVVIHPLTGAPAMTATNPSPEALTAVEQCVAYVMTDDAYAPCYSRGDVLYVAPRPPRVGEKCFVELADGGNVIGRFLGEAEGTLTLADACTGRRWTIPTRKVASVRHIRGWGCGAVAEGA